MNKKTFDIKVELYYIKKKPWLVSFVYLQNGNVKENIEMKMYKFFFSSCNHRAAQWFYMCDNIYPKKFFLCRKKLA